MLPYPKDTQPIIQWNHDDGPLLICKDGTPHHLTKLECLYLRLGFTNIHKLDSKYNSQPQKG